jgi:predicted RNA-binding protein
MVMTDARPARVRRRAEAADVVEADVVAADVVAADVVAADVVDAEKNMRAPW